MTGGTAFSVCGGKSGEGSQKCGRAKKAGAYWLWPRKSASCRRFCFPVHGLAPCLGSFVRLRVHTALGVPNAMPPRIFDSAVETIWELQWRFGQLADRRKAVRGKIVALCLAGGRSFAERKTTIALSTKCQRLLGGRRCVVRPCLPDVSSGCGSTWPWEYSMPCHTISDCR
jgi:hypothetical protein